MKCGKVMWKIRVLTKKMALKKMRNPFIILAHAMLPFKLRECREVKPGAAAVLCDMRVRTEYVYRDQ